MVSSPRGMAGGKEEGRRAERVRVVPATPEEQAAIAGVIGALGPGERLASVLLVVERAAEDGLSDQPATGAPGTKRIESQGRLEYLPGFNDVWLGGTHHDLRERKKARLCIQYLVEHKAFAAATARHLLGEIDPYVRKHGDFPPAAEIKIDHYFNDPSGKLLKLRRALIASAGGNGRYFLKVD